ncbi:Por secretion system C-terminal sorting domain-containing protein [Ekhidna lutea]|uniref:Por secretion system C-terminal sorting domain-containing protein n=1 Tax=Ekhidna lutea TaxID=447679 RepID=A0A239HPN2_EKHLU|nr:T9SS type A sorting domain-containing protein [Ekhidna lutea]SNS82893.1 Por secretion system C-terminal sorting domain-containing protein [Ekhidna lutea]
MNGLRVILFSLSLILAVVLQAQNESPDISLVYYVEEGTPNGTLIGTITAEDPDGDVLTHSLLSGNKNDAFALDQTTGDLTVNDQNELVFTANPTYDLVVDISDGNGGDIMASVKINVTEKPLGLAFQNEMFYPNPVTNYLYVNLHHDKRTFDRISIYSPAGKKVFNSPIQNQINLSGLKSGVYIIVFEGSKSILTNRLIVK